MSYIDVTGKTEEEAIRKALEQLGMDRDDVSVEILERAKSGFLGLGLGSSPARVRVTYGLDLMDAGDEDDEEEMSVPVTPAAPQKQPEKKAEKSENKPEKKPENKSEKKPEKKAEKKEPKEEKKETAPVAAAEQPGEVCQDENAKRIVAFLEGLLTHMESQAEVKVYEEEKGRYKVILEGQKLGQLIGRRGETLDAIQQLTSYAVNNGTDKRIRIHVDAENYRAKREQSLVSLANKVAAKVTKYRRSVTLEPMNAYERHVIHAALQDVAHVTTYSIGTEPNRRVVVSYDRDKQ